MASVALELRVKKMIQMLPRRRLVTHPAPWLTGATKDPGVE
jgi:hypothetical protein